MAFFFTFYFCWWLWSVSRLNIQTNEKKDDWEKENNIVSVWSVTLNEISTQYDIQINTDLETILG